MEAIEETGVVMSDKKRKVFSGEFKAKVALEAARGVKTVNEIAQVKWTPQSRQIQVEFKRVRHRLQRNSAALIRLLFVCASFSSR
jgi:hypothetical protein